MKFKDIHILKEERFSVGIEELSGKHYVSIPVSNGFVDYEEYYEIDITIFKGFPSNIELVKTLVEKYRKREKDEDLILKPGKNRGTAI
jgi:hypothetical protein